MNQAPLPQPSRATRRHLPGLLLALMLLPVAAPRPAEAGRSCEERTPTVSQLRRGMALAASTFEAMDAGGAEVYVIARAGQDLRRYRLEWSHLGYAYRSTAADGSRNWRVVHKLNTCGSSVAHLYRQGLAEFFTDDPYRYEAALLPLKQEVAARLAPVLDNNIQLTRLHEPSYNMVAYPWSQQYQQSNQWATETLALAMAPTVIDRRRAQAWLMMQGYQPTVLELHAMQRLGARITRANIAFDDHPNDKRFSDRIETTTADSVLAWLQAAGLAGRMVRIR